MATARWYENDPKTEKNANYYADISDQVGGTCYARASSHAIRETESSIGKRNNR